MAQRDPYVILGVARDASPAAIRSAFRALARRHHPDRAGPASAGRFAEIRSAYETLSDTAARRAYDEKRTRANRPARGRSPCWRSPPEPLRPASPWGHAAGPEIDELFERWLRALGGAGLARPPRDVLHCEIVLSPEEATYGAQVPVRLPSGRGSLAARLEIPAGVHAGTVLEFPILGVGNALLRAVIWIRG